MSTYSGLLFAELAATCNALGYFDGKIYHLEPHCKETVKDVIRYLRRDEGTHEVRRFLGNSKLLITDLLPMIQCHSSDSELFDIIIRLVVNLTTPAHIVYNEIVPENNAEHNYYLEIVGHLQSYKEAFTCQKSWTPFVDRLSVLLNKKFEDRDDDDQRTIERVLILVRNVLHIPPNSVSEWRPDNDASVHDQVLWGLHQSGLLDLLLYITSSSSETTFYLHAVEIICLMFREQPAALLAQTASQRSTEEKTSDDRELLRLRQIELENKQRKTKKFLGSRHSNFGGTLVVKNMKSASENDMIYHKPLHEIGSISFDQEKKKVKLPKNRQPLKCDNPERRSALSVRLVLKQFCVEFLHASYNQLMKYVRECFHRGKSQDNDESYYFTCLRFFMEFNRTYKFQVKFVSETLSVQAFQFIQKYLETWHEMMTTDKKKLPMWSTRMHGALRAYKELLNNLMMMDFSEDEKVRESAKVIKSNIFYVLEYREMLLFLAKSYHQSKYSKTYLVDLIESIHLFLKLLCDFCQKKKLIVQKSKKRVQKRKKKPHPPKKTDEKWQWERVEEVLTPLLPTVISKEVIPFDATLEKDVDEQRLDAIKRIRSLLNRGECEEAIALLRASREVWPEHDTFGPQNCTEDEELTLFKDIHAADLGPDEIVAEPEAEDEPLSSEEEEDVYPVITEQSFNPMDLIKRFATPTVIGICTTLLSSFETNTVNLNHCVAKMLHRIAWDCKLPAMLFQARLFIIFQKILKAGSQFEELAQLSCFIIRKFVEVADRNKVVFAELLFYKHVKDAVEIEEGYGSYQESVKNPRIWEEHEEDELRRLYEEYSASERDQKCIDWVMENIINRDRTKRSVMKKMKELGLVYDEKPAVWGPKEESALVDIFNEMDSSLAPKLIVKSISERVGKSVRAVKKKLVELGLIQPEEKKTTKWTEDQDLELTELYEELKEVKDVVAAILSRLSIKRTRSNVVSSLLRLGCIRDKSEVKPRQNGLDPRREETDSESEDSDVELPPPEIEPPPKLSSSVHSLLSAQDKCIRGGLKWIINCLEDAVEDVDTDPSDLPLLPLSEDSVLSMGVVPFTDFLWSMGFKKPIQHQEIYWRVPSTWNETELKNRLNLINWIVDNYDSPTDQERLNELLREVTKDDDETENSSKTKKSSVVSRKRVVESDSSDGEEANIGVPNGSPSRDSETEALNGTRQRVVSDSSDEEEPNSIIGFPSKPFDSQNGSHSRDSETQAPNRTRQRVLNDSSDDEGPNSPGSPLKTPSDSQTTNHIRRVVSDSSDEEEPNSVIGFSSKALDTQNGSDSSDYETRAPNPTRKRVLSDSSDDTPSTTSHKNKRKMIESDDEL